MFRVKEFSRCHERMFGFLVVTLALLILPISATGALSEDIQVHDINPVGSYEQNISYDQKAQFILVVKHSALDGNSTILFSNSSSTRGWNVEISEEMFILGPNSSRVVRITIWPQEYEEGCFTNISLEILAVKDSESITIMREYSVCMLTSIEKGDNDDEDSDGISIMGFHMELPQSLDNKIGRFIILTAFWMLFTIVVLVLLDPFIKAFTKKTETELDDIILGIIRKPIFILIIIYGLIESLDTLDPPTEVLDILERIYGIVFFGTAIYTAFKVFTGALAYMDKLAAKTSMGSKVHNALVPALSKVGSIIFFFIGLNVILGYLGMDLALLLGGMTIMGLVIAFAAQDTLSNFFGGIFLIMEPSFKQEDTIILQGITYKVKEIGMRTTRLYDISNHALVIIPNNLLANEKIVTLTEPDRHIKMNIEVGVAYGTDVDLVENTLLNLAKAHPEIITEGDGMPFVRFQAFGESSLDFKLVFWVNDLENRFRVRHEIMKRVNKKFEELEIEIPFPQRVVYMAGDGAGPVEDSTPGTLSDPFLPPPPPKPADPAATAEVKGETGKPLEEVIREREDKERLKQIASGNVDSDGFDDGGGDGGGDGDD